MNEEGYRKALARMEHDANEEQQLRRALEKKLEKCLIVIDLAATAWNDPYYYQKVGGSARRLLEEFKEAPKP